MSNTSTPIKSFIQLIQLAIKGEDIDFTTGSIRKAVVLLAIPMMLEMSMESVFALVDLYFVGHLSDASHAIQTVGLTESLITVIYSLAIGMSMAATAVVARRIGEKNVEGAGKAGAQSILVAVAITLPIGFLGWYFASDLLGWMGASSTTQMKGTRFVQIMMGGSLVIMLLFLINGIFRGAGNAAMAMKSLWLANIANIILCPVLIRGLGPIPAMGLEGAAWATTIGRGLGVLYQLYHLFKGNQLMRLKRRYFNPDKEVIVGLLKIAAPGVLQFVVGSCSWIFLAQLVATTGGDTGSAGYQTAIRLMMFFILPAWGMSNAAATLVGQNLGAQQPQRAEQSVYTTMLYNVIFMAMVSLIFVLLGNWMAAFFTSDPAVQQVAVQASRIIATGYVFYGIGMVLMNTFNGAGSTMTPTIINLVGFWLIQIPLAYFLAKTMQWGPAGVFWAIPIAETSMTVGSYILFRRGKWKTQKV